MFNHSPTRMTSHVGKEGSTSSRRMIRSIISKLCKALVECFKKSSFITMKSCVSYFGLSFKVSWIATTFLLVIDYFFKPFYMVIGVSSSKVGRDNLTTLSFIALVICDSCVQMLENHVLLLYSMTLSSYKLSTSTYGFKFS